MSDRTGETNPPRTATRVLLSGLAAGAVLGAPIAAIAATSAEATSAASVERVVAPETCGGNSAAAAIRDQFRGSFAAGAVAPVSADLTAVICETS